MRSPLGFPDYIRAVERKLGDEIEDLEYLFELYDSGASVDDAVNDLRETH